MTDEVRVIGPRTSPDRCEIESRVLDLSAIKTVCLSACCCIDLRFSARSSLEFNYKPTQNSAQPNCEILYIG